MFTNAGVTAGLDLALHVISEQLNARVAADIARDLVIYMRRAGSDPSALARAGRKPSISDPSDTLAVG